LAAAVGALTGCGAGDASGTPVRLDAAPDGSLRFERLR